ncbi:MAG: NAD-dependent epimerase/dehydratase family protein [Clostridiaceae bacterium]|jgi:nucleoside-diphosphate-sugar epimerase|nr:NAD-dependent epimerase/dehydratase family protein [Clostridiaceae bacterium]
MTKRKVLITGACGVIAAKIIPGLQERYALHMTDITQTNRDGITLNAIQTADLLDTQRDAYRHVFRNIDTVIHSAFVHSKPGEEPFFAELANVKMAYNVYQTCVEENVRRVVVISSNHAADYYENLIHKGLMLSVTSAMPPFSDNYYGWAKIAYEALGFVFATGNMNNQKKLPNVQIRIGGPRETDIESCQIGDMVKMHRALGAYLSLRDQLQLIEKSIEAASIDDENGIPFQIFYGVSNNSHNFWDIGNARKLIGYEPQDNSSIRFARQVARITQAI